MCSADNNRVLLEMVGLVCLHSKCLTNLILRNTRVNKEASLEFLQTLADDSSLVSLEHIDISGQFNHFFDKQNEAVEHMVAILARQTQLKSLKLL